LFGVRVGSGVSVATTTVTVGGGSSVAVETAVELGTGVFNTEVEKGVGLFPGVDVNIPPPPPPFTRVCVWKTGKRVRVGVAEKVAVFVMVALGVKVSVPPVMGSKKAKPGPVGLGKFVGVKNFRANAIRVNSISGGVAVAVFLGRRISSWASGDPPYARSGIRNAKNAAPSSAIQITRPSVFLFTRSPLPPGSLWKV
jgi:hypothetical protein